MRFYLLRDAKDQGGSNKKGIQLNVTYFLFSYLVNSIYSSNDS